MAFMRRRRRGASESAQNDDKEKDIPDTPMSFRRLLSYLRPYSRRLTVAIIALIGSSALSLVFPAVIQQVVDSVLEEQNLLLLDQITIALLIVFLIRSITSLLETYNLNYIGERIVVDIRKELYSHLQKLSLYFYTERRVGELVSRMSSDVTVMRTALTNNISTLLSQTLIMIGSIIVMFVLNWRLTMFIVVLIPIIVLLGFGFGFLLRRISTQVQDEIANATVVSEEVFQNIREVKSFVREPYEIKRYDSAIDKAFRASVKLLRVRSVFGPSMAFLGFGSLALILWFGGREVLDGRLTGGALIAFLVYGISVAGSFASLVGLYTQIQEAIGATKRVFQIIDRVPNVRDRDDATELTTVNGKIEFSDVRFQYEDEHDVIKGINLSIDSGEIVALVGPSGAGKSTIFNLIPRFYDVNEGIIRVDGHDIRHLTQASLREQIGIVPQETLLFGGTIRENILYGRLDASEEELIEASKVANAHDFIMELPNQYDTVVGERGVKLSGGQRQRVAIARAVLKNPRILLLDEATSSLDNESEHLVQEALGRLMQGRTTIIIAHRLSTIRVANRIAVLDKGEIAELGSHDELMDKDGLYAQLYKMQFRDAELA